MTVRELLGDLEARGIHVRPEGTHLRFRAPRRALTAEDRSLLTTHKTAVLETLRDIAIASRDSRALSANQLSVWLMHAVAPESTNYHIGFAARVRSEVNVASLHAACQALMDRHAVLRLAAILDAARGHQAADALLRLKLAGGVHVEETNLRDRLRPDVMVFIVLRTGFETTTTRHTTRIGVALLHVIVIHARSRTEVMGAIKLDPGIDPLEVIEHL